MKQNHKDVSFSKAAVVFLTLCNGLVIREAYLSPNLYPLLLLTLPLLLMALWDSRQQKPVSVRSSFITGKLHALIYMKKKEVGVDASLKRKEAIFFPFKKWSSAVVPEEGVKRETPERYRWN